MEETLEEKVVVVKAEKRHGDNHDDYSCSNILFCKYHLHEVVRAIFFKCFGFETSYEPAVPDVKDIDPPQCSSTTQPVPQPCPSSTPEPTVSSEEDMTMRFPRPARRTTSRGSGPETNSSGNS